MPKKRYEDIDSKEVNTDVTDLLNIYNSFVARLDKQQKATDKTFLELKDNILAKINSLDKNQIILKNNFENITTSIKEIKMVLSKKHDCIKKSIIEDLVKEKDNKKSFVNYLLFAFLGSFLSGILAFGSAVWYISGIASTVNYNAEKILANENTIEKSSTNMNFCFKKINAINAKIENLNSKMLIISNDIDDLENNVIDVKPRRIRKRSQ